ncbi:uncharacterized protein B0H18DRAFT_1116047 [Fomitopsis serialis]|uniref:uncharacterized protein n=1 Tax=Fomitopsis serialis TaxID=139415 RepID=UPI0020076348|nr:uncharacterized protein B0H18DRAFT_1116047 [Neoantrodia serialis]KAH9932398.1 hypothetical protein B0H18DRAFT_1116047 [Neoantrodia serialis]
MHWDNNRYPTAEHLFQAHKFIDTQPELAERIRHLPSARAALEEAGRYRKFQRTDWFDVNLRDMLLGTGDAELIEDSPVDSFWGCGHDGQGRNELGKALMRLRDKMRRDH